MLSISILKLCPYDKSKITVKNTMKTLRNGHVFLTHLKSCEKLRMETLNPSLQIIFEDVFIKI